LLPPGVTFGDNGNGTATLSGIPTASGIFTFAVAATNNAGSATQTFTLTVNQVPAISSAGSTTFQLGSAGSFAVTTSGYPAASLTETGVLPTGVTFTDNGNGTGTLGGTPTSGGTFTFTLTATNSVGTATQTFTLTVNQGSAITSANSATFQVGVAGSFTVVASGFPIPALTETGALPAGITFADNHNGTGR